jgi:hypothetical protein
VSQPTKQQAEEFLALMRHHRRKIIAHVQERPDPTNGDAELLREVERVYSKGREHIVSAMHGIEVETNMHEALRMLEALLMTHFQLHAQIQLIPIEIVVPIENGIMFPQAPAQA